MSRDLTRSMMSFGWAMTLFTADHLGGLLAPGGAGRAAAGLAAVAAAAEARLGARERALLYLGNGLERELAGRAGDLCAGWQELSDKLEAFGGFDGARSSAVFSGVAGLAGARAAAPLLAALERAAARGLYPSLWVTEGLGHAWAAGAGHAGGGGGGLFPAVVPGRAVLPLHTGASLWLAERLLAELARGAPAAAALERWRQLCTAALRPGHAGLAVEALGLTARHLDPQRVAALAELLRSTAPELAELFWHGVGRGLYFAPTHLPPWTGAARRAFAKAWSEPPDLPGRANATAGLAWALTLVNVRHPEVVAAALSENPESTAAAADVAIMDGTAGALLTWASWAGGGDPDLERFLAYRPPQPERVRPWLRLVAEPGRRALADLDSYLARRERLAELFRHREMP